MKKFLPLLTFSTLLLASPLPLSFASTVSREEKAHNEQIEKLEKELLSIVKKTAPKELDSLLSTPKFTNTLLHWKLQQTMPAEALAKFKSQRDPLLRSSFSSDNDWLMGFLNSGPNPNPVKAFENLSFLYKKDSKIASNEIYKKIATAAALEYARRIPLDKPDKNPEWSDPAKLLDRYSYFRTSYDKELLNAQFDKLDYWDMRILTGYPSGTWGKRKSMEWQRDNVRLPAQMYTGACWQAPYRRFNEWGVIVHDGKNYHLPFNDIFETQAELYRTMGAVCGGLSTYGANAAVANGVPALTMGEPGHCAYTVRTDLKTWSPAYSLSWKRGTHWNFYGSEWSKLVLTQDFHSDKEKYDLASKYSWLAKIANSSEDKDLARSLYLKALMTQPLNYVIWTDYLDWEFEQDVLSARQWGIINTQLCNAYARNYPEICWQLLQNKVYPKLWALLPSFEGKLDSIKQFHLKLDKMAPAQWDYPAALEYQFGIIDAFQPNEFPEFVGFLVKTHLSSPDYGGPTLSWCNDKASTSPERHSQFLAMVSQSDGGEASDKAITTLAKNIMLQAEKSGNRDSFQQAGVLIKDQFNPSLPDFETFPGELLSSGGLLQLSSVSSRWGDAWRHWGVLEACGGHFHSDDKLDSEFATVTMKNVGNLTGIVIIAPHGNLSRGNNCVIETSIDGSNWQEVGKIDKIEHINRIDLQGKNIQAKYVRITRKGKNFFHLNAILIYGTRAS